MDISVVIVNWNNADELVACLRSLYDDGAEELQVTVVDNASSDDSVDIVRRSFPAVEVIQSGANVGFGAACNLGIAAARGDWVFVMNNDAAIHPGGLAALRRLGRDAADDVGTLQPTLVFKDRPHQVNSTGIRLVRGGGAGDRDGGRPLASLGQARREIFCATGGAALYRRAMLEGARLASGVFDGHFFMYYEDVDLGWRCRLAGWRAFHEPAVRVAHRHQASSRRLGDAWIAAIAWENRVRTLLKNGSHELLRRTLPAIGWVVAKDFVRGRGRTRRALRAAVDSWPQRAEVEALIRVPRREVEARWLE